MKKEGVVHDAKPPQATRLALRAGACRGRIREAPGGVLRIPTTSSDASTYPTVKSASPRASVHAVCVVSQPGLIRTPRRVFGQPCCRHRYLEMKSSSSSRVSVSRLCLQWKDHAASLMKRSSQRHSSMGIYGNTASGAALLHAATWLSFCSGQATAPRSSEFQIFLSLPEDSPTCLGTSYVPACDLVSFDLALAVQATCLRHCIISKVAKSALT
jgi:hypothetical protein